MIINSPWRTPPRPEPLEGHAFFFDVDGTLLELEDHPDRVVADAPLRSMLEGLLEGSGGAVALLSGRSLADLDRILDPMRWTAAGQHGAELRLPTGELRTSVADPKLMGTLTAWLGPWVNMHPGLLLEAKGPCVAVHFRLAPDLHQEVQRRLSSWMEGAGAGHSLVAGKMVLEVRPSGVNKGRALDAFMATTPFRGRIPVCFGDDETDEDAFAAAREVGGWSVKVGEGPTSAEWRIPDVRACRAWIQDLLGVRARSATRPSSSPLHRGDS